MPLVCVHGWPESKRIFWRVIEPLAAAGFDVVVPDLRGFGDSDVGPDGFHDVAAHVRDVYALVHDELGLDRVVLVGGDLGGPVVQDLALRHPDWVDRMVLFNSPLPFDKERMAGMRDPAGARGERLLRAPGHRPRRPGRRAGDPRAAPAVHRHVLHVEVLGPPRRLPRPVGAAGPVRRQPGRRLPHRALRRRRQAAGVVRRLRERVRSGGPLRADAPRPQRAHAGRCCCSGRRTT